MKHNENGKIYYFQPHPSKEKTFTPIQEIQANFDLLKSIELGTGKAIGISSNDELLEWKQEKKAPNQKKNEFPFLLAKPVYHFHKIKFAKVLLNKTMCLGLDSMLILINCIRLGNGSVLVWGENKDGLLGLGYTATSVDHPTRVECLRDIIDIALSDNHAISINGIGEAFCWGTGKYGELGLDKSIYTPTPLKVNSTRQYLKVNVSNLITCFLDSEGHFSYYGVIIKILKGTFSFITVKSLLNDQSNSDPDTLFQEKIIVELEHEQFSSVAIGNGFIALLSKNGTVYALEHSDKLTTLYSKYYVYSLTVANNQILGLAYEKNFSSQTQRTGQYQQLSNPNIKTQQPIQLTYYFCQWVSRASDKDVSSEIWTTLIYKITEDLHLDNIALLYSNNRNVILIIERGVNSNLNSSALLANNSICNNKSHINISNDLSWDNITYNEFQVTAFGIMKKYHLSNTFLVFDCEYDDSYNMKFKRSKLNQERRSVSPFLNRTLISDNKSIIHNQYNTNTNHNKSCSSALICPYSERNRDKENNIRLVTNSSLLNNNDIETESVETKEKELENYQNEIDSIISNFKMRQKEKTTYLKQKIIKHRPQNPLKALDISNNNSLINTNTNPNINNQKSIEKTIQFENKSTIYNHLDTSNVNIETKNNISDIDGFSNKTRNENSNNNTLMKNELYSDIEEANIFNKSNCNMFDESSQLKLSSNFVFINPNKSNFLSPQFIKTSKFTKLYSSKEHSPNVTLKNTQKNLDKEILSKLKMSGNELCDIVSSEYNSAMVHEFSIHDPNLNKHLQMNNKENIDHCNTEANEMIKHARLDTQSTIKNKQSKVGLNTRSYSSDKNRIPNSHHKRSSMNSNCYKGKKKGNVMSNSQQDRENGIESKDKDVLIDDIDKEGVNDNSNNGNTVNEYFIPIKSKPVYNRDNNQGESCSIKLKKFKLSYEGKQKIDDSNKMSTIVYMENSSNFAYSNENLFEETPKFDTKNFLLQGSCSQRKNQHYKGESGDNYTQSHLLNDLRFTNRNENSSSNIEELILKRIKQTDDLDYAYNENHKKDSNHKPNESKKASVQRDKDNNKITNEENNRDNTESVKMMNCNFHISDSNSNRKENKHETSIRQTNTSSNKSKSDRINEQFNRNELRANKLEYNQSGFCIKSIQSLTIINEDNKTEINCNSNRQLNEETEVKENTQYQLENNLLFSFEPKALESNASIVKEDRNQLKDYYDIINEVNKDDEYRKAMASNCKSSYSKLKNEFIAKDNDDNDNNSLDVCKASNVEEKEIKRNILIQSEKDLKEHYRLAQLNNSCDEYRETKVSNRKYISDKKNNRADENKPIEEEQKDSNYDSINGNWEHCCTHQNEINETNSIKKTLMVESGIDISSSDKKKQNDTASKYRNDHQKQGMVIENNNNADSHQKFKFNQVNKGNKTQQDNVINFQKEKSLLSTSPSSKCQMNPNDNFTNNQQCKKNEIENNIGYSDAQIKLNSIQNISNQINKPTPEASSLLPTENIQPFIKDNNTLMNIFKYKSSLQLNNQNELSNDHDDNESKTEINNNNDNDDEYANNDTARLGGKEDVFEDKQHTLNKKISKSSHSQCTSSDDSRTHKKNYLIVTTSKEYINNKDYRISTIKDKIKSEENQNEDGIGEYDSSLSRRHFFNTNSNSNNPYSNAKAKLIFDSNKKEQCLLLEESNRQNKEVISKLLSRSSHNYSIEQKEELVSINNKEKEKEIPYLQKKTFNKTKPKRDEGIDLNDDYCNSLNGNNQSADAYSPDIAKKQMTYLPRDPNYRLGNKPLEKGMMINPEDTFGVNDSSSVDRDTRRLNQSIPEDKKALSPDKNETSEMKPGEFTFLPSTEKKRKSSLSIKISTDESIINMPRKVMSLHREDQNLSSNPNSNNDHVQEQINLSSNNSNSYITEQKIFTLKSYSNENDSNIHHNPNNALLPHNITNKIIENDCNNESKPSDRIIQLISKIKSSQNQIETSMITGQTLLKKKESYIETQSSNSNKNTIIPNRNNDNFYTFSNNAQLYYPNQSNNNSNSNCHSQSNSHSISNGNMHQLNEHNKLMTGESKEESNEKQKTRNSKGKSFKKSSNSNTKTKSKGNNNVKGKTSKGLLQESYENFINTSNKKQKEKDIKLSTEPNCSSREREIEEIKYKKEKKKDKMINLTQSQSNEEHKMSYNQTQSFKSKAETPSCDKGERSSLVSLISEAKLFRTKEKEKDRDARLIKPQKYPYKYQYKNTKSVLNKNSLNYFSFLVSDYMKKQVAQLCIVKICRYLFYRERRYSCRILSRVVKRRIMFYKIKFFHRCKKCILINIYVL